MGKVATQDGVVTWIAEWTAHARRRETRRKRLSAFLHFSSFSALISRYNHTKNRWAEITYEGSPRRHHGRMPKPSWHGQYRVSCAPDWKADKHLKPQRLLDIKPKDIDGVWDCAILAMTTSLFNGVSVPGPPCETTQVRATL